MRKLKTIYIHIGSPKAASTSLQYFIFSNAARLRELGYEVVNQNLDTIGRGGNPLWLIQSLLEDPHGQEKLKSKLASAVGDKIVISAENLSIAAAAELFRPLAVDFEFKVLYIIRRQDDWIYSAWKQWQSKTAKTLNHYIDIALLEHTPNYCEVFEAWGSVAGMDNVQVLSLDLLPGKLESVVLDWLELPSNESQSFEIADKSQNESFDFRILDILARHAGVYSNPHDRRIEEFISARSKLATSVRYRLSDAQSTRIMDSFHEDNVKLIGAEAAMKLRSLVKANRTVAETGDVIQQHDFAIACLFEALGNVSEELSDLRARLKALERK
ncbi:hypothetical protein [Rhizobium sp. EC-SD404]|uniref:hypothetical protein n=1 Tax=Rhizobium sp. EC-SD404 TaxID=2038389 RepID=UPI001252D3AC|nr:hypothetical protein [Rhizobium sp. EC-SD404]VVT34320.1 hypothetical protein RHIZ404_70014 [Rhizobium sp. EC-SD404]